MSLKNVHSPEEHIEHILSKFRNRYVEKYNAGQAEHGGKLWRKNTRKMLVEETLDFISYVDCIEEQIEEVIQLLENCTLTCDKVNKSLNILKFGNPEGIPEEER